MPNTQKHIDAVCRQRGIPAVRKGMKCSVSGEFGEIVGGNSSANFNVKFKDGRVRNCHPYWRFQIYTDNGLYYDYEQGIV